MNKTLADIIAENNHALNLNSDGTTIHEVQVCGSCKGEGCTEIHVDEGHTWSYEDQECSRCKGSGLILMSITMTSKPFKPKLIEKA